MNKIIKALALTPMAVALAACGGGSSDSISVSISGAAIDGPIVGATISAYAVASSGADAEQLASTSTDDEGNFTLKLKKVPEGAVRIRSSGGRYVSEADITQTLDGSALSLLLPEVTADGAGDLVIDALTTIADARATELDAAAASAGMAKSLYDSLASAEAELKTLYGFDDTVTGFSGFMPDFTTGSGEAAKLALVIGTLQEQGLRGDHTVSELLQALTVDLKDGIPDGLFNGDSLTYTDGAVVSPTLATSDFLAALTAYIDPGNENTVLVANSVSLDSDIVQDLRGAIVDAAPPSAALQIGSSGAVTVISYDGKQTVYIAARNYGVQGIDVTDPTNPVQVDLTALNTAIERVASFPSSIGGVIAVPGAATPQLVLYSYSQPRILLVDLSTQTVLADVSLSTQIRTVTVFSGGSAYISSGVPDPSRGVVWLASGNGYFPFNYSDYSVGTPVPLAGDQLIAENIGGNTSADLLFSPNYGASYGYGGVQLVSIAEQRAYALDDDQFQALFTTTTDLGYDYAFGIADSGAVDSVYNVGVLTGEHSPFLGFVQLGDLSKFAFDAANGSFTVSDADAVKTVSTVESQADLYPDISGVSVESQNHLALFMAGNSTDILIGKVDNPAQPAGAEWSGLADWAYYPADSYEYGSAGDPHAAGVVLAVGDGKSYGFLLSDDASALMIDMQAFLDAARSRKSHQLAGTPFDGAIVRKLPFAFLAQGGATAVPDRAIERPYGTTTTVPQ